MAMNKEEKAGMLSKSGSLCRTASFRAVPGQFDDSQLPQELLVELGNGSPPDVNNEEPIRSKGPRVEGKVVPLEVAMSYLIDLQNLSGFFRGMSLEELRMLCSAFRVLDVKTGTELTRKETLADYFVVLLHGTGDAYMKNEAGEKQSVSHFREGDFVGESKLFEGSMQFASSFDETVEASSSYTVVMVVSRAAFEELNFSQPNVGMRMLRITAEACTTPIFCPDRSERLPVLLEAEEKDKQDVRRALDLLPNRVLLEGLEKDEVDACLEIGSMICYEKGDKVFAVGEQANHILMLLFGQLEIMKGPIRLALLSEPGEVLGECLFPFCVHQNDVVASCRATLLSFSISSLYKLNEEKPSMGFQLTRNMVRSSLAKMRTMFAPMLTRHDTELQLSNLSNEVVKEMEEIKVILDDAVPKFVQKANTGLNLIMHILSNLDAEPPAGMKVKKNCPQLEKKEAVQQLEKFLDDSVTLIQHLGLAIKNKTILKANFHRMQDRNEEMTAELLLLNDQLLDKNKIIADLEAEVGKRDLNIQQINVEKNERDAQIKNLKEEMMEQCVKSRDEGRKLRERLLESERQVTAHQKHNDGDKGGDDAAVWHTIIKEQQGRLDLKEREVLSLREECDKLQTQATSYRREVVGLREAISAQIEAERVQEEEDEDEEEFVLEDETIPRLTEDIRCLQKRLARLGWATLFRKLFAKDVKHDILMLMVSMSRKYRTKKVEALMTKAMLGEEQARRERELSELKEVFKAQAFIVERVPSNAGEGAESEGRLIQVTELPEFINLKAHLGETEDTLTAARQKIEDLDEALDSSMETTETLIQDMETASALCYLLVMRLVDIENNLGRWEWTPEDTLHVKQAWFLLRKRGCLPAEGMQLDIEDSVLHSKATITNTRTARASNGLFPTTAPLKARPIRISTQQTSMSLDHSPSMGGDRRQPRASEQRPMHPSQVGPMVPSRLARASNHVQPANLGLTSSLSTSRPARTSHHVQPVQSNLASHSRTLMRSYAEEEDEEPSNASRGSGRIKSSDILRMRPRENKVPELNRSKTTNSPGNSNIGLPDINSKPGTPTEEEVRRRYGISEHSSAASKDTPDSGNEPSLRMSGGRRARFSDPSTS